jgi:membrane protease YdiL (CAAX protease family)
MRAVAATIRRLPRTETPTSSRRDRWITAAAWAAILGACAFVAAEAAESASGNAAAVSYAEWELMGRATVGMRGALPSLKSSGGEAIDALDKGPVELRQRAAVVAGEIDGPGAAHARLAAFDAQARAAGGAVAEVERVLSDLYPASPPTDETQAARVARLSDADRALLAASLGWFGRLALAPEGGDAAARDAVISAAKRTAVVNAAFVGGLCVMVPAGLALLLAALVQLLRGRLVARHDAPPDRRSFGAETFAAYLVLYVALSLAVREWTPAGGRLAASLGVQFASFAALGVPVLRGVAWTDLRRRIGWTAGAGVVREAFAGVVGWIACVPVVAAGVVVSFALQKASGHARSPGEGAHPVVSLLQTAAPGDALLLVAMATVMAPLLEETMFRGALYGHLREATANWPRASSVFFGAVVVSALFAAIHPQGWTGFPILASMAFSFALVRECRDSLVAPMVMHCMTNTITVVALRVALSS